MSVPGAEKECCLPRFPYLIVLTWKCKDNVKKIDGGASDQIPKRSDSHRLSASVHR